MAHISHELKGSANTISPAGCGSFQPLLFCAICDWSAGLFQSKEKLGFLIYTLSGKPTLIVL